MTKTSHMTWMRQRCTLPPWKSPKLSFSVRESITLLQETPVSFGGAFLQWGGIIQYGLLSFLSFWTNLNVSRTEIKFKASYSCMGIQSSEFLLVVSVWTLAVDNAPNTFHQSRDPCWTAVAHGEQVIAGISGAFRHFQPQFPLRAAVSVIKYPWWMLKRYRGGSGHPAGWALWV